MVRYRLLFLTSVPIIITLFTLIGLTFYWTVTYTWQNALMNVRADLAVSHHSLELLQKEQRMELQSMADSYDFQYRLRFDESSLSNWVRSENQQYKLDFIVLHPASALGEFSKQERRLLLEGKEQTFFQVLNRRELAALNSDLPARAQVPLLKENKTEQKGLVSRSLIPIFNNEGHLQWILDGGILLNNSTLLVDRIRDLVFASDTLPTGSIGTVTIFMNDVRISTNVPLDSKNLVGRAVGTRVSDEVSREVLKFGKIWVDRAYVYDSWYVSAYEPLRDINGKVIGMLYTGYLQWPLIKTFLTNIIELGIGIILVLIISGIVVYRGSRDLFLPIEKIYQVAKLVQMGSDRRVGKLDVYPDHELQILGTQFDTMLDQLEQRNQVIKQAAAELEEKVDQRTHSLHHKTEELEQHIKLLNQARSKLVISEKLAALGELTAGIAHEINNPLGVILGNVELIQFELGDNTVQVQEELDAIHAQIDRIRNITRSLLQYSRQGGVQNEVTWHHLNQIVEESLTLVRSGTKKLSVTFVVELNAKCSVEVNRHQLLQVLVNLQMNGIHAMEDKGRLIIRTEDWIDEQGQSNGAIVRVIDHGCGIAKENLERIFDPFFTTRRSGTWLGLSVSQSLIEDIGGEITVESEIGQGTTFSVYLRQKASTSNDLELLMMS
ncbi:putative sensor histidine kinase [Photobacterium sp. SKA34]|uniref:sensor histidine kinase n=1 Tax=Photobacterium sp. SKA34 TaxID=121723 RepID=UPI00006B1C91|nr:cache domain-containing protein [Photobacterium sp. SKA34]EAR54850.1 putative sensor histidine kinase [Photobacterium sp. SKA34]